MHASGAEGAASRRCAKHHASMHDAWSMLSSRICAPDIKFSMSDSLSVTLSSLRRQCHSVYQADSDSYAGSSCVATLPLVVCSEHVGAGALPRDCWVAEDDETGSFVRRTSRPRRPSSPERNVNVRGIPRTYWYRRECRVFARIRSRLCFPYPSVVTQRMCRGTRM